VSALAAGAAAVAIALGAAGARGEELSAPDRPPNVTGRGDLNFEDVVAGVPAAITRKDRHRAGAWWIRGTSNAEVLLTLTLPPSLSGPAGAQLPITFGSDDAGFHWQQRPDLAVGFNPYAPRIQRLGTNGHGWVFLGGKVQPALGQRAGAYLGNVVLTVAYTAQ
jgi:hypothetical protein